MTEKPKRTKTKPTWTDVMAKISEFDRAGLTQLVADLEAIVPQLDEM